MHRTHAQAPRSLQLLRCGGQCDGALAIQSRRLRDVEVVAQPTISACEDDLAANVEASQEPPAARAQRYEATVAPHLANLLHEEPDAVVPHVRICGGSGRTNLPGLPDS